MRCDRQEVGVSKDRELCFELQQISFGGAVQLTLLGCGVSAITLGDMGANRERGINDCVGGGLGFTPSAVPDYAQHFAAKGDRLLPNLEIPETAGHARRIAT